MRLLILILSGAALLASAARAEIPYRYPIQEGFIVAVDDASRRAVPGDGAVGRAALDKLAEVFEADIVRIPVEYGRTLVWNLGERLTPGLSREEHLALYRAAKASDASRNLPASVLFLRLSLRNDALTARLDWLDLARGESEARYASDPIPFDLTPGCGIDSPCAGVAAAEALAPFFQESADEILLALGPAPPRGYGDVPPAWLMVDPLRYRVDFRGLPRDIAEEVLDAMIVEFPYFLTDEILRDEPDRLTVSYETTAPSWWLADRLMEVFADLDYAATIEPRANGLRIEPAE
jgi:hypothetical protein